MNARNVGVVVMVGLLATAGGCGDILRAASGQSPGGPQRSIDMFTYESTTYLAQTVTLIDTRDDAELWSVDVPVGHRLSLRFYDNPTADDATMTDEMKWVVTESKNGPRAMKNRIPAPPSWARRLDVSYRDAPERAPEELGGLASNPG